jgi:transposase
MNQLEGRQLTQREGAKHLQLSERQVRRVWKRFRQEGDGGLVHKLRGCRSNRRLSEEFKDKVLGIVRKRYEDFGPTLACEYLEEGHGVKVSRETLRGWMAEAGIWTVRASGVKHRAWRERRACCGELVQMDSSIHRWFEGRGEEAVLIFMIDDATSRLHARFFPTDSTRTNMAMLRSYMRRYGRPLAIYADKASHFMTTRQPDLEESLAGRKAQTQIERALKELGIEYIAAHSPQAKGRVERGFGTAQDRLVKGLRVAKVSTIREATKYLERTFLPLWNDRFTVKAASGADAHRPLEGYDVGQILSVQTTRTVGNDYTIRHHRKLYQIARSAIARGLRRSKVIVEERLEGARRLRWRGRYLRHREITTEPVKAPAPEALTPVGLRPPSVRASKKPGLPGPAHPWRKRTVLSCRK